MARHTYSWAELWLSLQSLSCLNFRAVPTLKNELAEHRAHILIVKRRGALFSSRIWAYTAIVRVPMVMPHEPN